MANAGPNTNGTLIPIPVIDNSSFVQDPNSSTSAVFRYETHDILAGQLTASLSVNRVGAHALSNSERIMQHYLSCTIAPRILEHLCRVCLFSKLNESELSCDLSHSHPIDGR